MATYADSFDNAASADTTTAPLIASASSNIRVLFNEDEMNTACQLYELFHEPGPRYLREVGTDLAELVLFVVGQNPKPVRTTRSQAPSQPFHTNSITFDADTTSNIAYLVDVNYKNSFITRISLFGKSETQMLYPSSNWVQKKRVVEIRPRIPTARISLWWMLKNSSSRRVRKEETRNRCRPLCSTSDSTPTDYKNPQPTPSQQLKPFPIFTPRPYTEKQIPSVEQDEQFQLHHHDPFAHHSCRLDPDTTASIDLPDSSPCSIRHRQTSTVEIERSQQNPLEHSNSCLYC